MASSYSALNEPNQGYLKELRQYLERRADHRLQDGQTLDVTITNIDMAGEFEPQHGPTFNDVRVVKDIYPPRINLQFTLRDANGNVITEGQRQLSNLAFGTTVNPINRDDPLRHEKNLLDDFLRDIGREAQS